MIAALLGMVEGLCHHLQTEFAKNGRIGAFSQRLKATAAEHFDRARTYANRLYQEPQKEEAFPAGPVGREIYDLCCCLFYREGLRIADEGCLSHYAWRDPFLASQHFLLK